MTLNQYNKNMESSSAYIIETYNNGTSWYRIWSDGWCEQGAMDDGLGTDKSRTITFLIPFATTDYSIVIGTLGKVTSSTKAGRVWSVNDENSFNIIQDTSSDLGANWIARGLIS